MKLFLDFDGVVNFDASRNAYRKNKDSFGYVRRDTIHSHKGDYRIDYAAELIKKLNDAKATYGFTWLWLTTWVYEAPSLLDPRMSARSDGYVPWFAWDGIENLSDDDLLIERANRKYEALKIAHDGQPFIWIDDEATIVVNPEDFDVPYLLIAPDPKYGMVKSDLDAMLAFLELHK